MAKKDNTLMYVLVAGGVAAATFLLLKAGAAAAPSPAPILQRNLADPKQRFQWITEGGQRKCFDHKTKRFIDSDVCDTYFPALPAVPDSSMLEGWR